MACGGGVGREGTEIFSVGVKLPAESGRGRRRRLFVLAEGAKEGGVDLVLNESYRCLRGFPALIVKWKRFRNQRSTFSSLASGLQEFDIRL